MIAQGQGAQLHLEVRADRGEPQPHAGPLFEELAGLLATGYPPGLALAIVDRRGIALAAWGGWACLVGERVPIARDTLFDLASLTKVVATVTLALRLQDQGRWELSDAVARWLPGYPQWGATLWNLVTHTSGLVPHRPFYETCRGARSIRAAVKAEARVSIPSQEVVYSDLNFMVLGWAIERCTGERIDRLFAHEIARPLRMTRSRFRPPPSMRRRIAATELDGDQRTTHGLVWGSVHDGNAFALGGVAGHAGLFAPLEDVASFARSLLDPSHHPVLAPATLAAMATRQAGSLPDVRGLGWRLQPVGWGSWPEGTYWHTGFTGTSLLVSPGRGIAVALLMNGVHPRRRPEEQQAVRARIHTLIAEGRW